MDFMPQPESATHVQLGQEIVDNERYCSDHSGYSNKMKWASAMNTFGAPEGTTLFAQLNYEEVYKLDDAAKCEAAAYIADLRAQYFAKLIEETFTPERHLLYLANRQWQVRFRERAALAGVQHMLKGKLLH